LKAKTQKLESTIKQQKPIIKKLKPRIENEFEDEIDCEDENKRNWSKLKRTKSKLQNHLICVVNLLPYATSSLSTSSFAKRGFFESEGFEGIGIDSYIEMSTSTSDLKSRNSMIQRQE